MHTHTHTHTLYYFVVYIDPSLQAEADYDLCSCFLSTKLTILQSNKRIENTLKKCTETSIKSNYNKLLKEVGMAVPKNI